MSVKKIHVKNDGTCMDMEDGYECECESGFTGPMCETNINRVISR